MTTKRREQVRSGVLAVAVAGLLAAGCERTPVEQGGPTTTPAPPTTSASAPVDLTAGERRPERVSFLVRAASCERFADAVRPVALEAVTAYGFGGQFGYGLDVLTAAPEAASSDRAAGAAPAPAPKAGVDFSATNVQEAGVDEPDLVKTDGRLLVTTSDGRLRVVDVSGAPRQVGVLDLPGTTAANLLLVGSRALVLSSAHPDAGIEKGGVAAPGSSSSPAPPRPTTKVTVVDLADPAKPLVARTHTIDGSYVDARLVGGVARVITRSQPDIAFPPQPQPNQQSAEKAQAANAEIVRKARAEAFLPRGAACADAYVPAEASGVGTVAVQSVDPAADAPGPAVTVVADASTVYASATRLFVATSRFGGGIGIRGPRPIAPEPAVNRTAIHAFDITDPAKARYAGSGDVPGQLLNQFSLSEDAGVLRVATTLDASSAGQGSSQSRVTILRPAGEEWVETGSVDGLGKGERIYAVRFLGATGYVVTFRQVDPLYVLDLRDVRKPRVTGELKITGYSAYLHPAGDRRLLGLGQEATEQGRRMGTQLSLFDVSDPSAPTKLAGAVLANASSSAEYDHHAFLYWPATGLVVAPVQSHGDVRMQPTEGGVGQPFVGVVTFQVGDRSVTERGRITHPGSTTIERSLVVGDRLLTLSRVGIATNDLRTMADGGFLAFR